MSLLGKFRLAGEGGTRVTTMLAKRPAAPADSQNARHSNVLKDFLWLIGEGAHARILDLGPVWQSTVNFFIERGFNPSTEDLLRSWSEYQEEQERRALAAQEKVGAPEPAVLTEGFLGACLNFPAASFQGVLAWDVLDYLEGGLLPGLVARLYDLLRPGGVLLAAFHSSRTAGFHHYRILNDQTLEIVPSRRTYQVQRVFQNREILNLFGQFRSSKTYVGRDQLREGLFMK